MTLEELRKRYRDARQKAGQAKEAAFKEGADATARDALKAAIKEAETALEQVKLAEQEEALEAMATKDAIAPAGSGSAGSPAYAEPALKVADEQKPLLHIAAQAKAAIFNKQRQDSGSSERLDAVQLLKHEGYGSYVKELDFKARKQFMSKAPVGAVASGVSSSVLLPQPVASEILPILMPETTFLQGNPRRVQLIGGKYRQARGTSSATAAYVGEGAKKPVGTVAFDDIDMTAHKLAGIVYMTNEAVDWTIGRLEEYIRNDLRRVMGLKMDSALYFGTGAGATPTGIFNQAGVTTLDGSMAAGTPLFANNRAPTVSELDIAATRLILSLTGANIPMNDRWRWTFGYRTWSYLANMRDGNGNKIYPELDQGRWKNIRYLVSNQFAENGGATTDVGSLGLVDFSHVLFAEEEGMTMRTSTEATIDDDGTLVLLWQQNMSAILCEMQHDVAVDQAKAVAQITGVRMGSASGTAG